MMNKIEYESRKENFGDSFVSVVYCLIDGIRVSAIIAGSSGFTVVRPFQYNLSNGLPESFGGDGVKGVDIENAKTRLVELIKWNADLLNSDCSNPFCDDRLSLAIGFLVSRCRKNILLKKGIYHKSSGIKNRSMVLAARQSSDLLISNGYVSDA